MKKWIFSLALLLIGSAIMAQCTSDRYTHQVFSNVTTTSGIQFGSAMAYGGLIPQALSLDLYEPSGDTISQRPLIVYAFGGGFLIGTRIDPPIVGYCTYLAKCGYVVASIDYRIGFNVVDGQSAERAVYRGVQDLRGAVRFLCQRYPQYRIDTNAIFLTGSSAGCFSGLHSCFMEQNEVPARVHGTTLETSDIGCYDCDVNADNNRTMPKIRGIINHWGAILDTSFIRTTAKDNVPTISFQGDQDNIVPYITAPPFSIPIFPTVNGALPIHLRMDDIGLKNELHTLVGYGHEPWLLAPQLLDTCYLYTLPFLYSILKPKPVVVTGDATVCLNYTGHYSVPYTTGSRYCWDVTGGTILSNTNNAITIQWTSVGTHILTVRELTRNKVNGDLDSFTVNVIAHPVAAFGDSVLHAQAIFSDSSVGAVSWAYNFGDNGTSALENPSHTYHSQGTFTVRLIVSNGYCADTTFRTLVTDTCPSGETITYTVSGDTVFFTASPSVGVQYSWHFGDGDSSNAVAPFHVYNHSQNYLVSLWSTTTKACRVYGSVILPFTAVSTGINEAGVQAVKVYPNPTDGLLHISAMPEAADLILYDLEGQKIAEQHVEIGAYTEFNMNDLSSGIYMLKIKGEKLNENLKITKR